MQVRSILTSWKGNKPRQIADGACFTLLSDIKPDAFYGLSPIVPFQLWAEVQGFNPGLGSASGEARLTIRWGFFFHFGTSLFAGFTCRDSRYVSRAASGTSKSGLHRIDRDLNGTFVPSRVGCSGSNCVNRNLSSQQQKPAPEKAQRQHETLAEMICDMPGSNCDRESPFF